MKRLIIPVILLAVFVYLIVKGGKLGDFTETESVASVMCLSCMGIE
jgi:hypothetical protein